MQVTEDIQKLLDIKRKYYIYNGRYVEFVGIGINCYHIKECYFGWYKIESDINLLKIPEESDDKIANEILWNKTYWNSIR